MNQPLAAPLLRLLLVEDSRTQREMLTLILEESGGFELVGAAADGVAAVEMAETLRPDIVLMDCHLPRANGFEAARRIMESCPVPIVMISSTGSESEQFYSFEAVKAGALAFLAKPRSFDAPEDEAQRQALIDTLRLMTEVKVVRRLPAHPRQRPAQPPPEAGPSNTRLFAIAGSTGAPGILIEILAAVGQPAAPVLVVQHMARGFVAGFAKWMENVLHIPVIVPRQGEAARAGHVYLAPDDLHMGIGADGIIRLNNAPPEEGFQPSADYLFRAVAAAYRHEATGILLSGMGRDGAAGLRALRDAGGCTAVQDEASCVVFGMPGAAVALGAARHVLPPSGLAQLMLAGTSGEERKRHE